MTKLTIALPTGAIRERASQYPDFPSEPAAIAAGASARSRGWLTDPEFEAIAKWKSTRPGKRYAANRGRVEAVSRQAFDAASDVERVLILTELSGVRVRTATALLHLGHRDRYPLLDVWALTAFGIDRNVTEKWDEIDWLRIWPAYVNATREIADLAGVDMRTLDRALWTFGEKLGSKRKQTS